MYGSASKNEVVLTSPPLTPPHSAASTPRLCHSPPASENGSSPKLNRTSTLLPPPGSPSPPSTSAPRPATLQRSGHAYPGTPNLFSDAFFSSPQRSLSPSLSPEDEEALVGDGARPAERPRRASSLFPSRRASLDDFKRSSSTPAQESIGLGLALGGLGEKLNILKREETLGPSAHPHRSHKSSLVSHVLSRRSRPVVALCLVLLSILLFAAHHTSVWQSTTHRGLTLADLRKIHQSQSKHLPPHHLHAPPTTGALGMSAHQWVWGPGEELAAVVGFMTSEGAHSLHAMKTGDQVDPAVVLDFDAYHSSSLKTEMAEMVEHVWSNRVVVLFGANARDPATKKMKNLLHDLVISPSPVYIELDSRADSRQVDAVLRRTLPMKAGDKFPQVLIGGQAVDTSLLDFGGEIGGENKALVKSMIEAAGGKFNVPGKKQKKFAGF